MEASNRRANHSLTHVLSERGYEFQFFQAIRLLLHSAPADRLIGDRTHPSEECVRFHTWLSLAFPASPIHAISSRSSHLHDVTTAFFGLTGTVGVLPYHYTEHLLNRAVAGDHAMAEFFDLFTHRLTSLFYRAWERHHPYVARERALSAPASPDPFTRYLYNLIGMGTGNLRGRMPVADETLLFYAGLISQRPRSAVALQGILRDYFQVPVQIDQCLGSWYPLKSSEKSYMNRDGLHNQLGIGAIAGEEVWDQQARFRLRLGPLPFNRFVDFLPNGAALEELTAWVRYLVGPTFAFDVNIVLLADEVPHARLQDDQMDAPRLGWIGWLKTEPFTNHAADVEFTYLA